MSKRLKGFTLIELLIVVAIIAILAAIAVPNFLEAQTRSKVARVRADLRSLATAIETYYIDNNSYPAHASSLHHTITGSQGGGPAAGANQISNLISPTVQAPPGALYMPTFRTKVSSTDNLLTLTTPISYITSYFNDPFADSKGVTFNYSLPAPGFGIGWILWSYGPDVDEKIPNPLGEYANGGGDLGIAVRGEPTVSETVYNPNLVVPNANLQGVTYDPTNGTVSNGDVFRVKQ